MKKVYINRNVLNRKMISEELEIVRDPREADFLICWTRVPRGFEDKLDKIIYIAYEPPLTGPVFWAHERFNKFHTVYAYNPDPNEPNQFHMTENPIYYPVNPFFENDISNKDTTLTTRGIYYSGARCKGMYANVPNRWGVNFKDGRDELAEYLLNNYKNTTIIGSGWPIETKVNSKDTSWRVTKMKDIEDSGADFHLCVENYFIPYLMSERFHDGIGSDRVMLYLGDPKIGEWIPKDCYIDLRPYFDEETNTLSYDEIIDRIKNISQKEYDNILQNAREFRKQMSRTRFLEGQDRITKHIIDRIKND